MDLPDVDDQSEPLSVGFLNEEPMGAELSFFVSVFEYVRKFKSFQIELSRVDKNIIFLCLVKSNAIWEFGAEQLKHKYSVTCFGLLTLIKHL